jgi:hypothetical protein
LMTNNLIDVSSIGNSVKRVVLQPISN